MVTPVVIAGAWQVREVFSIAGIPANVVSYVAASGALTQAKTDTIGQVYRDAWFNWLRARSHPLLQYTTVQVTDVTTALGPSFSRAFTDVGTGTTDLLPPQTAAVITWKTAKRGRSYRGRSYYPGFTENDSAGQTLAAGLITALGIYAPTLRTNLGTAGYGKVVGSRLLHTCEPVTGHTVRPYWRTQRRRVNPY